MRDKEIIDLYEAYNQVHSQQEEVELDEAVKGVDSEDRRASADERKKKKRLPPSRGRENVAKMQRDIKFYDKLTKAKEVERIDEDRKVGDGMKKGGGYDKGYEAMKKEVEKLDKGEDPATTKRYREMKSVKEQTDLYCSILSHLLDEGYASTEESADKIILNMSEAWFEDIMELNRYAKETKKDFKSGRPSVKGGNPEIKSRNKSPFKYGGSREEPKVPGKKPPVAGEKGSGRQTPAHMVDLKRAHRERMKNQPIGSRFD